jgi:flavin reductase (DIM6/NTAB) family NADH-FMN oxidoreductase RutF
MTTVDFATLPPREAYAVLTHLVVPRPIAFVSTISLEGVLNLAPFSFFMAGGSNPPSVAFSPTLTSKGLEKDTLRNIREQGEFVVNTVHRSMSAGMNATSVALGPDESEWPPSGFTPIPSELVRPPRVEESLAQMECRLFQVVEHGEGPTAARYVIGEVLRVHLRREVLTEGVLDPSKVETIARLGGPDYLDTRRTERFELPRP